MSCAAQHSIMHHMFVTSVTRLVGTLLHLGLCCFAGPLQDTRGKSFKLKSFQLYGSESFELKQMARHNLLHTFLLISQTYNTIAS